MNFIAREASFLLASSMYRFEIDRFVRFLLLNMDLSGLFWPFMPVRNEFGLLLPRARLSLYWTDFVLPFRILGSAYVKLVLG